MLIKYERYNNPDFTAYAEVETEEEAEIMIRSLLELKHITRAELIEENKS